ncbi:ATP-binding protein [Aliagarivorans taiwanensis]|uniref:ATP-binding protein n=1 Tax=Aliagarivorans taiwanensis TaxID=561966 RepID=UPI0004195BCD|nr:ATP-binding protein [Aliagarivorans taiwanensis]
MSGLLRIILIDTHLNGVVELKLDQHSNICGTNASGKTTLQRLIPVFYGEYPSRVVPSTRDSFERWYLPREASYISYEYQQHDGQIAQVILSSAREEQGVKYRLVGKPFDLEDFVKQRSDTGILCFSPDELGRAFKKREYQEQPVAVSRMLNTRQYRAIIQNDRGLQLASDGDIKQLAQRFSMCDPRHSLRHIEKLAKAVHSKEGKMETIKSMIAAILEEDGVSLTPTKVNAANAQSWIQESQLIEHFESNRPKFVKLEQSFHQLQSNLERLSQLNRYLKNDQALLAADSESQQNQQQGAKLALQQLETQWKEQSFELQKRLSQAQADESTFDEQLNQIEDQYNHWQDKEIDSLVDELELLPGRREQLAEVTQRHQLLTEQHSNIEAAFNQRKSETNEQLNNALAKLHPELTTISEQLSRERQQQQQEISQLERQHQQQQSELKQRFSEQQHQRQLEQVELKAKAANLGFDAEQNNQLNQLDTRLEDAQAKLQHFSQQRRKQEQLQRQALDSQHDCDKRLTQARHEAQSASRQIADLREQLHPQDNSLLANLRSEAPGWEEHIGKLIAPELLSRRDLKPEFHGESDSFFGLKVDLKAIELPAHAKNEAQLKQELQLAEAELEQYQLQQQQAEQALAEANSELQKAKFSLNQASSAEANAEEKLSHLQQEKQLLKEQFNQQLETRRLSLQQQLTQLQKALDAADVQHQEHLSEQEEQAQETRLEKMAWWQERVDELEDKERRAKQRISERQQQAKQALDEAEQWYRAELQNQGLDDAMIIDLANQQKQLKQQILSAEESQDLVNEYRIWHKQVWLQQKPSLLDKLQQAKQDHSQAKQDFAQAQAAFKASQQQQQSELKQLQQKLDGLTALQEQLAGQLKQLKQLQLPPLSSEQLSDPDQAAIAEHLREAEQALHQRKQQLQQVEDGVRKFDSLLAQQAGSEFSDIWERARQEHLRLDADGDSITDYVALVPTLSDLLNGLLPQKIQGLIELGRNFGMSICNFYQNLRDIDQRIESQSRRITKEIGEDLSLDGVSGSAVKIRSKIAELEFWGELESFVSHYQQWEKQGFSQLPESDYALSMKQALEIIGRSALKEGIGRLLMVELHLREGNSDLIIRTDRQLNESSSHGMAYLILCKFLLAFTRLLRGNADSAIHWPIDELGTLHQSNVKKIFQACDHNNIRILGAFPNPESEVLDLFTHRYIINREKRQLQIVQPRVSALQQKLEQARKAKEAS